MKIKANGKMIFLSGIRIVNMCEQLFLGLKISPGAMCTGGMVGGKGQKSYTHMLECEATECLGIFITISVLTLHNILAAISAK